MFLSSLAACASKGPVTHAEVSPAGGSLVLDMEPADWSASVANFTELEAACEGVDDELSFICRFPFLGVLVEDDHVVMSALVASFGSTDPRVRAAAARALGRMRHVYADAVFAPAIVEAAERERDPAVAQVLGPLVGRLLRSELAPGVREAISTLLMGEGMESMRVELARGYLAGDSTVASVEQLAALVLDEDEPDAIRAAALEGISRSTHGGRLSDGECAILYGLPGQDPRWSWPVLEHGLEHADECVPFQRALLLESTQGVFDVEHVGRMLSALIEGRQSESLEDDLIARALTLATRDDLSLSVRVSALTAYAQVDPASAFPIATGLSALASSDPMVNVGVRDRAAFITKVLDPKTWGEAPDPFFTPTVVSRAMSCHVLGTCPHDGAYGGFYMPFDSCMSEDYNDALLTMLRGPNVIARRFAAMELQRSRCGALSIMTGDGILEAALTETDSVVLGYLQTFVATRFRHGVDAPTPEATQRWRALLQTLVEGGTDPKLRAAAANALSFDKDTKALMCSVLLEADSQGSLELVDATAQHLSGSCRVCDAQWASWIDRMSADGIGVARLAALPGAIARRSECRRSHPTRDLVRAPESFERAIEAASADPSIPAIVRREALHRLMDEGVFGPQAAARLAERVDAGVSSTARRLATYGSDSAPQGAIAGFWASQNERIVVELARAVLLECVWFENGTPDEACQAFRAWRSYGDDAASTLLEFLWDEDPRVRWLGAHGLSTRSRWHQRYVPRLVEVLERVEREEHPHVAHMLARLIGEAWGVHPEVDVRIEELSRRARSPGVRARVLEGALASTLLPSLPMVARVITQEPSDHVRRYVAAWLGQRGAHELGFDAACSIWLDYSDRADAALRTRGLEGVVGVDCVRAVGQGSGFAEEVVATWVALAEDGSHPDALRSSAVWALEYGAHRHSAWLAKLAAGEGVLAESAAAAARRRDVLGPGDKGMGLADEVVHPSVRDGVARVLRCVGKRGEWSHLECADFKALVWLMGGAGYRGRDSESWPPRIAPEDAESSLIALVFDPDPRVRQVAYDVIERRMMQKAPTGQRLRDAVRAAAAVESSKGEQIERILGR